jgi:Ca-activated chloride channel family protein
MMMYRTNNELTSMSIAGTSHLNFPIKWDSAAFIQNRMKVLLVLSMLFLGVFNSEAQQRTTAKPIPSAPTPPTLTRILLIFDCSNSMFGIWESDSKYNIAKRLVSSMVDSLGVEPNVQLALRCYGHQKKYPPQDCDDTKLEVPFARDNGYLIKNKLNKLAPSGTTPIALSLEACAKDFPDTKARNIVLLITDGKEECGGDPCAISAALQSKGIVLRPFIVGVGKMDPDITNSFNCIGNFYDASSESSFKQVLNVIITQVLNTTTCQVNLLDKNGKPTETDVAMTFYDQKTNQIKYNLVHTMNNRGVPDTLRIDGLSTYRIVAHTLPPIEKKDVQLVAGKHTVIPIDAPQGFLNLKAGEGAIYRDLQCIIRKVNEMQTLDVMSFKETRKLIVGKYDLEILTLPRTYLKAVDVAQSHTTTIKIDEPGTVNFQLPLQGVASILMEDKGSMIWVCNLNENTNQDIIRLQPGKYKVVFRGKGIRETLFTIEKNFTVQPGTSQQVAIK